MGYQKRICGVFELSSYNVLVSLKSVSEFYEVTPVGYNMAAEDSDTATLEGKKRVVDFFLWGASLSNHSHPNMKCPL